MSMSGWPSSFCIKILHNTTSIFRFSEMVLEILCFSRLRRLNIWKGNFSSLSNQNTISLWRDISSISNLIWKIIRLSFFACIISVLSRWDCVSCFPTFIFVFPLWFAARWHFFIRVENLWSYIRMMRFYTFKTQNENIAVPVCTRRACSHHIARNIRARVLVCG